MDFRWNQWNEEHMAAHGVQLEVAEEIIRAARAPFPLARSDEKDLVWGPTDRERLLQVVFLVDEDDSIFVIHARPLTGKEKKRYRRMR